MGSEKRRGYLFYLSLVVIVFVSLLLLLLSLLIADFLSVRGQYEVVLKSMGQGKDPQPDLNGALVKAYVLLGVREKKTILGEVDLSAGRFLVSNDVVFRLLDLNGDRPRIKEVMVGYVFNQSIRILVGDPALPSSGTSVRRDKMLKYYRTLPVGTIVQLFTVRDAKLFFDKMSESRGTRYQDNLSDSLVVALQSLGIGGDGSGILVTTTPSIRDYTLKSNILIPWLRLF